MFESQLNRARLVAGCRASQNSEKTDQRDVVDERLERGRSGAETTVHRGAEGTPGRVVLSAVQIQSEHLTGFPAPIPQASWPLQVRSLPFP